MIPPTKAAPPRVSTTVERAIRRPALPELGGGQGIAAHEPEVPDERPELPVLDEPWRVRGAGWSRQPGLPRRPAALLVVQPAAARLIRPGRPMKNPYIPRRR